MRRGGHPGAGGSPRQGGWQCPLQLGLNVEGRDPRVVGIAVPASEENDEKHCKSDIPSTKALL